MFIPAELPLCRAYLMGSTPFQVYTYGAPRVGNHAFAHECRDKLPELWNVINDQVSCSRHIGYRRSMQ